jgi:exonuclease VII small subunit
MFGAPRAEPTLGARIDLGRAAASLGWVAFGALAVGVATRFLWRGRHGPSNGQEPDTQEPDVLLNVSELEVDKINLEVEDLRAHVSILVELANLLSLSVGVDARLDQVKLEIEGVEADVLLKVRLKHIRAILEKALDTIGEHPEILRILARSLSRVVRESLEGSLATLDSALEGLEVGDTVDEVLRSRLQEVRDALEDVLERSEREVEGAAQTALGEGQGPDTPASA